MEVVKTSGFTFLPSYYQALRPLPDDQRHALYDAILDYAIGGKEPEDLPPILAGYFILLRPNIDSSVKHYSSSVENGKRGGRPIKNNLKETQEEPSNNPAETQHKPNDNPAITQEEPSGNREKEKGKECEKECERVAEPPEAAPTQDKKSPVRKKHGVYGWVQLTDEEYSRLSNDLGETEVKRCIAYIDESAQSTGNKNHWRDWNLVLRKCSRDGWGLGAPGKTPGTPPSKRTSHIEHIDGEEVVVYDS